MTRSKTYAHTVYYVLNSANAANMNVVPKVNLNATLSSSADRRSTPLTYFCILAIGMMCIPLEARNCSSECQGPLMDNLREWE